MRTKRYNANKGKSAKAFSRNTKTVKAANMSINPMRGGWRM